jgi:hypothetical protein
VKGQLSQVQDMRQEQVENRLSNLGAALALLEHDGLRVRQAIDRETLNNLEGLLGPVLEDLELVKAWIRRAQDHLRAGWEDGQENRWEP